MIWREGTKLQINAMILYQIVYFKNFLKKKIHNIHIRNIYSNL